MQQQRDAIERYAEKNNLKIIRWFEEQETAAKQGRPMFNQMIKLLKSHKVRGVIIHKIDRSARNLKDWSDLGELIDQGVEVFFANESLDLNTRGGRLSADIQAVVAADYIRNLREETLKGINGRLKQGLYPRPAPLGYLDQGPGKVKVIDPAKGPLVRQAFELYSTGRFNYKTLAAELNNLGLRMKTGSRITSNHLWHFMNNPFYIGLIYVKRRKETFNGVHEPLISKSLYDRVQELLHGKSHSKTIKHEFLFRRRLRCGDCKNNLVGETHDGWVYYRCHTPGCRRGTVREEVIEQAVLETFKKLEFSDEEKSIVDETISRMKIDDSKRREEIVKSLELQISQIDGRINRLTDALVDQLVDKQTFEQRKTALLLERKGIEEKFKEWTVDNRLTVSEELAHFLERASGAYSAYKVGKFEEKRELVDTISSNRLLMGKSIEISLALPFHEVANRFEDARGWGARIRT